jgi:hypothetical protein
MSVAKKARTGPLCCEFPEGDTLGVVLSFLPSVDILRRGLFRVSKEWMRVLCRLPHAWCPVFEFHSHYDSMPGITKFAWRNATVRPLLRTRAARFCFTCAHARW